MVVSDEDHRTYEVYPRIPVKPAACDYDVYDTGSSLTGLTFEESYTIRVEKEEAEEPNSFLDGNIAGVVQAVGDKVRLGLEFYNDDAEGGYIANYIGGDVADLVCKHRRQGVRNLDTPGRNPLRRGTLFQAGLLLITIVVIIPLVRITIPSTFRMKESMSNAPRVLSCLSPMENLPRTRIFPLPIRIMTVMEMIPAVTLVMVLIIWMMSPSGHTPMTDVPAARIWREIRSLTCLRSLPLVLVLHC